MKKFLKQIWEGWKRIAHKIGRFQTKLLLTLFYFLIISPVGAVMRAFGWDPLDSSPRKRMQSNWKDVSDGEPDIDSLRRQS